MSTSDSPATFRLSSATATGRTLDPLAYPRDWQVVDGELVSTAALKLKGEGRGARTWDQLRDLLDYLDTLK